MIGANQFNQLVEVSEGAMYRGMAHKTTRGVIPRKSFASASVARSSPYRVHGVNGTQATVTGSFSASTPYLRINIATNTSEWSAVGGAWPPDTVILDGRMTNCPEEYWVLR